MLKGIVSALLLVCLVAVTAPAIEITEEELTELETAIETSENEITALQMTIDELQSESVKLKNELDALQTLLAGQGAMLNQQHAALQQQNLYFNEYARGMKKEIDRARDSRNLWRIIAIGGSGLALAGGFVAGVFIAQ